MSRFKRAFTAATVTGYVALAVSNPIADAEQTQPAQSVHAAVASESTDYLHHHAPEVGEPALPALDLPPEQATPSTWFGRAPPGVGPSSPTISPDEMNFTAETPTLYETTTDLLESAGAPNNAAAESRDRWNEAAETKSEFGATGPPLDDADATEDSAAATMGVAADALAREQESHAGAAGADELSGTHGTPPPASEVSAETTPVDQEYVSPPTPPASYVPEAPDTAPEPTDAAPEPQPVDDVETYGGAAPAPAKEPAGSPDTDSTEPSAPEPQPAPEPDNDHEPDW